MSMSAASGDPLLVAATAAARAVGRSVGAARHGGDAPITAGCNEATYEETGEDQPNPGSG